MGGDRMTDHNVNDVYVPKKSINKVKLTAILLLGTFIVFFLFKGILVDTNFGGYILMKEYLNGQMEPVLDEGVTWKWGGSIYTYKRAGSYRFVKRQVLKNYRMDISASGPSIEVRFNDGGTATISGYVRFILSEEPEKLINMHSKFRSYDNLVNTGVKQLVIESIQLSAAMMSSEESYTTMRAEFSEIAWDQITNGIYLTEQEQIETKNPKTGKTIIKLLVKIKTEKKKDPKTGEVTDVPLRKENPLSPYGIKVSQFVITDIDYESGIKKQIAEKRSALMETIAVKAKAEKATQERMTAEEVGKKNVMISKYKAEVNKVRDVTNAEMKKDVAEILAEKDVKVAEIDVATARWEKKAKELRAQASFVVNNMKFRADNALELKLKLMLEINQMWAEAFKKSPKNLVPRIMLEGKAGKTNTGNVGNLIDMLTIKTAKDLSEKK
jgi:hypothetical protein